MVHVVLILSMVMPAYASPSQQQTPGTVTVQPERPGGPWTLSDEERIARRVDRAQAAARVKALRSPGDAAPHPAADVIVGKEHAELFLPTELFQTLIQDGFLSDQWREMYAPRIRGAGLGTDFWDRLRVVAEPFVADLERQRTLLASANAGPAQRAQAEAQVAGMYRTLCHDRLVALQRARVTFGPELERLLYEYVARKTTLFTDDYADAEHLREEARGCQ